MRKITLFFMLLALSLGYSQSPTDNPPTPTNDPADVISVYGDTYTNVATNYDPNWGQSGHMQVNPSFDPGTGQLLLAYPNFNYQGTELTTQNAAAMEYLHVDIWTNADPNATTIQVSPINNGSGAGETLVTINYTQGSWTSVDIPKADFTNMTWDSVFQMKFAANGPGSTVPVDIYLDNIYFWKAAVDPLADATLSDLQVDGTTVAGFSPSTTAYTYELSPGTTTVPQISATTSNANANASVMQASSIPGTATVNVTAENGSDTETYTVSFIEVGPSVAAPTPPSRPTSDVISIFSDAYTNIAVSTYDTSWCPSTTTEVMIESNTTHRVTGAVCEGIDFANNKQDASTFNHFHIDFFTSDTDLVGKVFNLKLVDFGGGTSEVPANNIEIDINTGTSPAIVSNTWVSVDVLLSQTSTNTLGDLAQFVITSNLENVWYDNLYLHKNTTLSTGEFDAAAFKVFPNPTKENWMISGNTLIESIAVFDILGKQVLSLAPNANEVSINASTLKTGVYFARVEGINGSKTVKLIKN